MKNKVLAIELIQKKLNNDGFMTYKEIADITNYHPKYISKLKKQVIDNKISLQHGNKNKKSSKSLSEEEINKIMFLYKKSHVSIRKFSLFYNKRSYSCIYGVLKKNGLID